MKMFPGDFVGIGAEMQKDKQIMITSPMKDSPAEKPVSNQKMLLLKWMENP